MNPKVLALAAQMQAELESNSEKGNWEKFQDKTAILGEIYHHQQKLLAAIHKNDIEKIKEHIADTCNCFLFLANAYGFLEE